MSPAKYRLLLSTITVLGFLLFAAPPARAQTEGLRLAGEAGLDGYCKEGAWMPMRVTVENDGDDIEGILFAETENGGRVWEFGTEASIPSVSRKEWTLYVQPLGREDTIVLGVRSGNVELARTEIPVNCVDTGSLLMGVWAANPSIFNTQTSVRTVSPRPVLVQLDAGDIPDRPIGLAMLDTLTISDVDTGALTPAQREALAAWVASGGRLVVAGGPGWQKTGAGLGDLLPLTPTGTRTLDGLAEIATLAQRGDALAGTIVAATGQLHAGAEVIASQDGLPLVVSKPAGFGEIIYLAVDPALEPLRTWIGMEDVYAVLLGSPLDTPTWHDGFKTWAEAEMAMNAIPGLGLPSAWLICGFILCYIGVAGPLNFVVLRSLKRRELAWVSIPVLVLFFSGFIFLIGTTLIGNRPIVNRLAIVQVWPGEQAARVDGLVGVFSPARDRYSLTMESSFAAYPIPDTGFAPEPETRTVYQTDAGFRIPEVQVGTGGLEGFVVSGQTPAPRFDHDLTVEWQTSGSRLLSGEITNSSGLNLTDALLLTISGVVPIGDFGPGDSAPVSVILGGAANPSGPPPFGPAGPGSGDDTLFEVFGTYYMYPTSVTDIEDVRRFNLFSAALDPLSGNRGTGIYLLGWTDAAPFETELGGGQERNTDSTLYIIHLRPDVPQSADPPGSYLLTPDLFHWSPFGDSTGSFPPSPYDSTLGTDPFALRFTPTERIPFTRVRAMTLHLLGYGERGSIPFDVELWDFERSSWALLASLAWGDNDIADPEPLVGPDGEIRLRLTNPGTSRIDIQQANFTLEVLP